MICQMMTFDIPYMRWMPHTARLGPSAQFQVNIARLKGEKTRDFDIIFRV